MSEHLPIVVIVGGGFGGLAAAKALKRTPARIILIDRTNHHLFQPLLCRVATSVLTPGQIGSPIRSILRTQTNTTVLLGEVTGVSQADRCVLFNDADRENVPILTTTWYWRRARAIVTSDMMNSGSMPQ